MTPIVIGTRGSALAVAQTRLMMGALRKAWPNRTFEIQTIKTQGDRLSENPATAAEPLNKGLFTAELERALFSKQIDIAVHSLKDLPTDDTAGLKIGAIPARADARDVLVTRGPAMLADLPMDARIATGSPRRAAQLTLARADLRIVEIRGNIDTRLRKLRENAEWSGLLLAAAGLERLKLDLTGFVATPLPFKTMLPAPGQGALALQTRQDATEVLDLLEAIHDPATAAAVRAERMFLHALGGGCLEPVGAYAEPQPGHLLRLEGIAWLFDEKKPRRGHLLAKISQPDSLGIDLAVEISR